MTPKERKLFEKQQKERQKREKEEAKRRQKEEEKERKRIEKEKKALLAQEKKASKQKGKPVVPVILELFEPFIMTLKPEDQGYLMIIIKDNFFQFSVNHIMLWVYIRITSLRQF